jgi:DNA replication and repair protein RecF
VWISSLQLENFRNYTQLFVELKPGINLLVGENGAGKTNLAEACVFLSELQSHRVAGYGALIKSDVTTSQLSVKIRAKDREVSVAAELNRDKANRYFINTTQQKRASDLAGTLKVVVFAPEDLDLVRRDPSDRRSFMDQAMIQLKPRLAGVKSDYERVLKQKNALLKSAKVASKPDLTTLDIWDDQLVALGSEIIWQRQELLRELTPLLQDFYSKLSNNSEQVELLLAASIVSGEEEEDHGSLAYSSKEEISGLFYSQLEALRPRELERGISLVGPHRDELVILKDRLPARSHCSQGEAWSLALGLKLALAELIRKDSQTGDPVLILDDVFAVLDSGRRSRLVEFVVGNEQVIITTADQDAVPELAIAHRLKVEAGEVHEGN